MRLLKVLDVFDVDCLQADRILSRFLLFLLFLLFFLFVRNLNEEVLNVFRHATD